MTQKDFQSLIKEAIEGIPTEEVSQPTDSFGKALLFQIRDSYRDGYLAALKILRIWPKEE